MGKKKSGTSKAPATTDRLSHPAVGMESEFNVWVDGVEVIPEKYWKTPLEFFDEPLLPRVNSSFQLPTGGAVYFDRGVIEVVTPVIEIGPRCAARVVRSLWEQIGAVRSSLSRWEQATGREVRLKAYSTHYNVSFEIPPAEQNRRRNVRKLAWLLANILPPPLMMLASNRQSTGVGVRPRGDRIEITIDFTPDPALMIATAAAVVGIVRDVMSWPSYELSVVDRLPIPRIDGVVPGKHTTRKGWLTKDIHYPQSPYETDPDARVWKCVDGKRRSLRRIAWETALFFESSIRQYSDPFSARLLFGVLRGRDRSLLDLASRPVAYDHVGVLCRWGQALTDVIFREAAESDGVSREEVVARTMALRRRFTSPPEMVGGRKVVFAEERSDDGRELVQRNQPQQQPRERRSPARAARPVRVDRRKPRARRNSGPYPDTNLSRSLYERVFLELTSGKQLLMGNERWVPVGMESWYRAKFRSRKDGRETSLTIDELARHLRDWK